jgi:hypothetical protein
MIKHPAMFQEHAPAQFKSQNKYTHTHTHTTESDTHTQSFLLTLIFGFYVMTFLNKHYTKHCVCIQEM